ncbi:FixH family protein [Rasiella rasia]|uniref:FixH family protein n=1 Tax=Rasiella rasia TaxID=2744027 RepID=A0A6G6GMK2_9FLAO|nr:FixH family protein [Rasiella rasia]QIE59720.1 FixH family protein [Rasiella rasia]
MKINWGTGLVIGMALFIGFILFFVFRISTDKDLNHDLVTEGYYQKEMELQEDIYAQQNTAAMEKQIAGKKTEAGYMLQFPAMYNPEKIEGKVFLYRPSNQRLDFEIPLKLNDPNLLIPDDRLVAGRWNITIDWEYEGKSFRYKKEITY